MPQNFSLDKIRNTVLLSHGGAGKTSLVEATLFSTGAISRLGKVAEGSTTGDYDHDEVKRKISIKLSLLPCQWKDAKINIIDTPGYADFVGEVKAAMRVVEGAVVLVCSASGVEVGTEQVWGYCEETKLPRLIFINKQDRENADFFRATEAIRARFGNQCIPIQLAIGAHTSFQGVIDLLNRKAYIGSPAKESEIPANMQEQAKAWREKLVEAVAETDDRLIEKYLGGEELTLEEIKNALRKATLSGRIVPILTGSGLQTIGMSYLLDAIYDYLPSPKDVEVVTLTDSTEHRSAPSLEAPLSAFVFKTSADPYVGKLTYFRVYHGSIESNSQVYNCTKGQMERIGQLFFIRGKTQETTPKITAGEIGAVAKLNFTTTNDTLGKQDKPVKFPPIKFPEPIFGMAVYPKTKLDLDKLGAALTRIVEEDPTLRVHREADTVETVLYGLGETQLGVAADKMMRKFGVGVELSAPKVPYKETITVKADADYKHKKQSGGHGQYGHVVMGVEPLPRGSGTEFTERVVGGSVPRNYIPAVEKGAKEAFHEGVLGGYPVVDVRATLYDGSYHAVDSSDICFKIAGAGAVKKGLADGRPILLEPVVNITVKVSNDLTGDIISDLNTKRARVLGMNPEGEYNTIEAQAPLAEVQRYAIDLRSMTQGRGTYSMKFSHYEEVPAHVTQKIIAERQAEREKAKAGD